MSTIGDLSIKEKKFLKEKRVELKKKFKEFLTRNGILFKFIEQFNAIENIKWRRFTKPECDEETIEGYLDVTDPWQWLWYAIDSCDDIDCFNEDWRKVLFDYLIDYETY